MTDKSEKLSKKPITLLQDVIVKSSSINNTQETCRIEESNHNKRRYTSSTYIFDEEPIFSDSEEEAEYYKTVLAFQNYFTHTNESPKKLDVEIQCNITSDDLKIVDAIKKCASIDVRDVDNDFKQLIDLCKKLQSKNNYLTPISTKKTSHDTNNETVRNDVFVPTFTSDQNFYQKSFLPSRNSDTGGEHAFLSQKFSFDSGILSSGFVISSDHSDESKENAPRRSNRKRRTMPVNSCGIFITGINKRKLLKKRARVKTKRNSSQVLSFKKTDGRASTAKGRRLITDASNIQMHKVKKRKNNEHKTSPANSEKRANLEDSSEFTFYEKTQMLPSKQSRSLARSWMKPNKSVVRLSGNCKPVLSQHNKMRRLYTPEDWSLP